jgi:Metallo-peptidase family M12/Secretion system C-terminal sorting domain
MRKAIFIIWLFIGCFFKLHASDLPLLQPVSAKSLPKDMFNTVAKFQVLKLDKAVLKAILEKKPETLSLSIPVNGKVYELALKQISIFAPGFNVKTGNPRKEKNFNYTPGLYYQGEIFGIKGSMAAISLFSNDIMGLCSGVGGNLVIGRLETGKHETSPTIIAYNDADLLIKNNFTCTTPDLKNNLITNKPAFALPSFPARPFNTCRTARIYFEADHVTFNDFGQDTTRVINYITGFFNVTAYVYQRDSLNIQLSRIKVNTIPDNYDLSTSFSYLHDFSTAIDTLYPGEMAHGISTVARNLGGVATTINGLCNKYLSKCISNIDLSYRQLPLYSWTINVVAHEMGHLFGSPHTQNCSWDLGNGQQGMLDSCYTPEGNCYLGPRIGKVGTIMSYCHITGRVDLNLGFGALPGNRIRDVFYNAPCLSGSGMPTVRINQVGGYCAGDTARLMATNIQGASYLWSGPNGFSANGSIAKAPLNAASEGIYTVIYALGGCSSPPIAYPVKLNCLPISNLSVASVCNQTAVFTTSSSRTYDTSNVFNLVITPLNAALPNYLVPVFRGSTLPATINASLPNIPAGQYQIRIDATSPSTKGNTATELLSIRKKSMPISFSQNTYAACGLDTLVINAPLPDTSGTWFNQFGQIQAKGPSFQFIANRNQAGKYFYQVKPTLDTSIAPKDTSFASGSMFNAFSRGNLVTVYAPFTLDSVTIFADSGSGLASINFSDPDNFRPKYSAPLFLNPGRNRVYVGLQVMPGRYRVDAVGSDNPMYRNNKGNVNYPFVVPGVISMDSSTAGRNFYYFFYDWRLTYSECPSLAAFVVLKNGVGPKPVLLKRNDTLFTTMPVNLPQWYFNGSPIPGANLPYYRLGQSGNYFVKTTDSLGCFHYSDTVSVILGTQSLLSATDLKLYPNPAKNNFTLQLPANVSRYTITIEDITGKTILSETRSNSEWDNEVDVTLWPLGYYRVKVYSTGLIGHLSLIKN